MVNTLDLTATARPVTPLGILTEHLQQAVSLLER